jgi:hypothetical protein
MNFEVKKKTLFFDHYNIVDPKEQRAITFEVDVQQGNFKILWLSPSSFTFNFLGKMVSSTIYKTA